MQNYFLRANKPLLYATALSITSILVLIGRIFYTYEFEFAFLISNLFLAWIPFAISYFIYKTTKRTFLFVKIILCISWVLFFPNSGYIITDIFHLDKYTSMPQWFDLLMLVLFSWSGITWGFISLQLIQKRFLTSKNTFVQITFILLIFFLSGVGIYLGRYERWNSWDVLFDFGSLFSQVTELISNSQSFFSMLSMGILYCILLSFMYFPFTNNFQFLIPNNKTNQNV